MPQCKATGRTTGAPCRMKAIAGAAVCRMHGGAAPQVKEKARQRLLALIDPALATVQRSLTRKYKPGEYPTSVELAAARDILNRAGIGKETAEPTEALTENGTGGFTGTLEELLITLRKVTISSKPDSGCGD